VLSAVLHRLAHDERGFTLIEALVAIVAGIVVLGAGYALLEISLHQSTRINDVSEVTQTGRSTMTKIVDPLHSACVSSAYQPVREGSSSEKLVLRTAYSEASEITGKATAESGGREDIIEWKPEAGSTHNTGQLLDTTYLSTEGTAPNFVIPQKNGTTRVIGERIQRAEVENAKKEKQKSVFQYYEYKTSPTSSTTEPSSTLTETELASGKSLTAAGAAKVSSVGVRFTQLPKDFKEEIGQPADFTSQVTFAFTAPSTEAKIEAAPCE
jgi:Tfp pilus assembly protein PilW